RSGPARTSGRSASSRSAPAASSSALRSAPSKACSPAPRAWWRARRGPAMASSSPTRDGRWSERVLVLAPTRRDGELSRSILGGAGMKAEVCASLRELCREIDRGAAALLLTEDTLGGGEILVRALAGQPNWSDLPVVLL